MAWLMRSARDIATQLCSCCQEAIPYPDCSKQHSGRQSCPKKRQEPPISFTRGHLLALLVAWRLGSFSAAAEELEVTQRVIPRRFQKLEAAIGVPPFSRVDRGIRTTP